MDDVEGWLSGLNKQPKTTVPQVAKKKGVIHPELPKKRVEASAPHKELIIFVTRRGMLIKKDTFSDIELDRIKKQLTYIYEDRKGKWVRSRTVNHLFEEVKINEVNYLQVARHAGIRLILPYVCYRFNYDVKFNYKLTNYEDCLIVTNRFAKCSLQAKDNQTIVLEHLFSSNGPCNANRIKNGVAGGVLVMGTGEGKSYTTAAIVEHTKLRTLIIIPNTNNRDEFVNTVFRKHYPYLRIGVYEGGSYQMGDVVIMIVNSAIGDGFWYDENWEDRYYDVNGQPTNTGRWSKKKEDYVRIPWHQYFSKFGMVIYDEAHEFASNERQKLLWRAGAFVNLGLTATPNEHPMGMDPIYIKQLGPLIVAKDLPGYALANIKWKGVVTVIKYYGPAKYCKKLTSEKGEIRECKEGESTMYSVMCKQLCMDTYRNRLVLYVIRQAIELKVNLFIFTLNRARVSQLYNWIKTMQLPITVNAPEIVAEMKGGMKSAEFEAAKLCQVIPITYSFGKQSLSIVRMDGMFFDVPSKTGMRQKLGRMLRMGGDAEIIRKVWDIQDMRVPLSGQMRERKIAYDEKEFPITYETHNWEDYDNDECKDVCDNETGEYTLTV